MIYKIVSKVLHISHERFTFYKRRTIFINSMDGNPCQKLTDSGIETAPIDLENVHKVALLHSDYERKKGLYLERLRNRSWLGILAIDRETREIIGHQWAVFPEKKDSVWHDCLPIKKGSAYSADAYIVPEYRGRRLHAYMKRELIARLVKMGIQSCYAVVENMNERSFRSNSRTGRILARNVLIKLFGRNILSIVVSEEGHRFHFVLFKRQV